MRLSTSNFCPVGLVSSSSEGDKPNNANAAFVLAAITARRREAKRSYRNARILSGNLIWINNRLLYNLVALGLTLLSI